MKIFIASVLVATCSGQINTAGTMSNHDLLGKFVQLLDRVGISPSTGETVFAPTTDAWQTYREQDVNRWNKYVNQAEFFVHFKELLLWHFVTEGKYSFDEIFDGSRGNLENQLGNITVSQAYKMIDNVEADSFVEEVASNDGIIHVINDVIIPPFLNQFLIEQMLDDRSSKFAYSTMANLALWAGLDDHINGEYEHGITFLVPPNRRFNRAEFDVPSLLTPEMRNYTRDLVLCHLIMDNYHEAGIFAMHDEEGTEQSLVVTELGTHMWITTTGEGVALNSRRVRFQSTEVLIFDQAARNG